LLFHFIFGLFSSSWDHLLILLGLYSVPNILSCCHSLHLIHSVHILSSVSLIFLLIFYLLITTPTIPWFLCTFWHYIFCHLLVCGFCILIKHIWLSIQFIPIITPTAHVIPFICFFLMLTSHSSFSCGFFYLPGYRIIITKKHVYIYIWLVLSFNFTLDYILFHLFFGLFYLSFRPIINKSSIIY